MSSFREVLVFEMPSRKAETLSRGEQYYSDKVKWCIAGNEPRLLRIFRLGNRRVGSWPVAPL